MKNKLVILIPTYNRKNELINTLSALEKQSCQDFNVIISDNCSNYEIKEVMNNVSYKFSRRIKYIRNSINIGTDLNIFNLLLESDSQWAWILADDDFIVENAIENILNEINLHKDYGWIDFPVYDVELLNYEEKTIKSIPEMLDYFDMCKQKKIQNINGNFIFVSNKIYNMTYLRKNLSFFYQEGITMVPTAIFQLKILDNGAKGVIVNKKIVNHNSKQQGWNPRFANLKIKNITNIYFDVAFNDRKRIYKYISLSSRYTIYHHFYVEYIKNDIYLEVMYHSLYKFFLNYKEKIIFRIFILLSKSTISFKLGQKILKIKNGI